MDRIEKINELTTQIEALKEKTIILDIIATTDQFTTAQKAELEKLNKELRPLLIALAGLKYRYLVKYRGELYHAQTNTHYWSEEFIEEFLLVTYCKIDKLTAQSFEIEGFKELMNELSQKLYFKIGRPEILDIRMTS